MWGVALIEVMAHPRVSGENRTSKPIKKPETGSSPRERGKLKKTADSMASKRLIPA